MKTCKKCGRITDRPGHRYDQLCQHCDYCRRYSHIGNPCSRCGFPTYPYNEEGHD